jgi:hypothetical protein
METIIDFRLSRDSYEYDVLASEEISDSVVALQQEDTPIVSIGDISTITGVAKSRKTFLTTAMIVAFLKSDGFMGLNSELQNKKVLLIDTEQSRVFVQRVVRRIYRMLGYDYSIDVRDCLRVLSLRELTPEQRFEVIKETIETYRPQLVFIDGTADLVNDTNSIEESTKMVNSLMRLSSERHCHICNVVHTNPNTEKTRGHIGSELQRKSETVMLVTKEGDVTTVKPQFTRNIEFAPFSFIINEKGLPELTETVQPKQENLRGIFEEIYSYSTCLGWGDLQSKLMDVTGKGKTACENRIKKGLEQEFIYKDIEGMYRLYVKDNNNEILPF